MALGHPSLSEVLPSLLVQLKVAFFSLIIYLIVNEHSRYTARIPHINGPPGLPLIGNLAKIRVNAAEQYRKWSKEYGPVYQIMLGNVPVVVVNSAASAKALFIQICMLSVRDQSSTRFTRYVFLVTEPLFVQRPTSDSVFPSRYSLTLLGQQSEHPLTTIPSRGEENVQRQLLTGRQ